MAEEVETKTAETKAPETKKYLLDYFISTRSFYGTYHNHKETTAWAGVAAFVLACAQLLGRKLPENDPGSALVTLLLMVLALTFIILKYISNQLRLKDRGSHIVSASSLVLLDIILDPNPDPKVYATPNEKTGNNMVPAHDLMPKYLSDKAKSLEYLNQQANKTRRLMYSIVGITCVFSIVMIACEAKAAGLLCIR